MHSSYQEAEHHLQKLLHASEEDLSRELTCCSEIGKTPLHLAVEKCDFKMTEILLSFGAPIDPKLGNVKEFAKEIMKIKDKDIEPKRIYALIKSKAKLQKKNAEPGLLARSMKMIEPLLDSIKNAAQKNGVLFLGITGEGKSTLINYLSGVDYQYDDKR